MKKRYGWRKQYRWNFLKQAIFYCLRGRLKRVGLTACVTELLLQKTTQGSVVGNLGIMEWLTHFWQTIGKMFD